MATGRRRQHRGESRGHIVDSRNHERTPAVVTETSRARTRALVRGCRDEHVAVVDACLDASRGARGEARAAILARLATIEQALTQAATASLPVDRRTALLEQVRAELSAYRGQMPATAFREAGDALLGELARRHFSLPQVRLAG